MYRPLLYRKIKRGRRKTKVKCFKCGTELKETTKFCPKCGTPQGFSEELLGRAKNGDQDAIAELYNRTYHQVYFTVKAMVKDEDTILDIVQDSYVKGFRSLEQLKEADKFQAWMKVIAHNKTIDHLRKSKPVIFSQMSTDSEEAVEFEDDRPENLPEVVVDQKETTRLMKEILDSLSDEQRLVVGMFYYEQLGVREIAQILGISENTVKSRLSYGRKKIEGKVKELEKRGTKLYSLAPIPFLMLLFQNMDAKAAEPDLAILKQVCESGAQAVSTQGHAGAMAVSGAKGAAKGAAAGAGKGIAAKVIAGIVVTAVVGAGTVAGLKYFDHKKEEKAAVSQQKEVKKETKKEEPKAEKKEPTIEEIYQPIIDEYASALRQAIDTSKMPVYNEAYPNVNSGTLRWSYNYYMSDGGNEGATGLYYVYHDVDGNGTKELVIERGATGMMKEVADLYTIEEGKPKKLFDVQDDETSLFIYSDGTMEARVFNGEAMESFGYEFSEDGTELQEYAIEDPQEKTPFEGGKREVISIKDAETTDTGDAASLYNPIINEYKASLKATEYDEEKYPNVNTVMWNLQSEGKADLLYAYHDVDGNGMPELLVGYGSGETKNIAAIYGKGKEAYQVATLLEIQNGYTRCDIYPDGKIKMEYYDAGMLNGIETYTLSADGSEAVLMSEQDETNGQKRVTDFQWMEFDA